MSEIFYIAAGSSEWGIGHLRRSLAVISRLKELGISLRSFAWVPLEQEQVKLSSLLANYDCTVHHLSQISIAGAKGFVVDVNTACQPEILSWFKKNNQPVIGLDWYDATTPNFRSVINLRGGVEALKYAIIGKEFLDVQPDRLQRSDAVIAAGGSDRKGYLLKLITILQDAEQIRGRRIVVLVGPLSVLEIDIKFPFMCVEATRQSEDVARIMASTKVGLSNGGTALMEFTMLGKPTIVFPQTEEEEAFVETFFEQGCSVPGVFNTDILIGELAKLWERVDIWSCRSQAARVLIDGKGAERIAEIVCRELIKK